MSGDAAEPIGRGAIAFDAGAPASGARAAATPPPPPMLSDIRGDLRIIAEIIEPGSRVLDIGCGDGTLLAYLTAAKQVDGRGMELSQSGVNSCVQHGLSVIQGDADHDLDAYPQDAFDYVVLSQTLQATHSPRAVVENLVRIGRRAIVSFPNFAYWRIRAHLLLHGTMPITPLLNQRWYDTPNIHLCTIRDFVAMCDEIGIAIDSSVTLDHAGRPFSLRATGLLANLLAAQALFVLRAYPRRPS